jgi:hypothetical protein
MQMDQDRFQQHAFVNMLEYLHSFLWQGIA